MALTSGLEAIRKNKAVKWLSDDRAFEKPYPAEDAKWLNKHWLPGMLSSGWKYWAVVESEKFPMGNALSFYENQGLTIRIFHKVEDAEGWLRSIDQKTS